MQSFLVPIHALYFTKPSNTFSMAFQKVLRGFVAKNASACVKDGDGSDGKI